MLVRAFIPAHITAFFVPVFNDEPLLAGSLGAGVSIDKGVSVFLSIEDGLERHIHIAFDGEPVDRKKAKISYAVADELVPEDFTGEVEVWQYFDFPNGYGFANSGGGALGTALAVAYAFKNRTLLQAAGVAHKHEVLNRGGLGDIVAQLHGGVEIRVKAGGPGIGVVDEIFLEGYRVLALPMGRLSTREVLDGDVISSIKREGQRALDALLARPTVENMMHLARSFAESTGLLEGELLEVARELDGALKIPSSMVMLGRGLFAFLREDEVENVKEVLSELSLENYVIADVWEKRPKVGRWLG